MTNHQAATISRRTILRGWLALSAPLLLAACAGQDSVGPTTAPTGAPAQSSSGQTAPATTAPTQPPTTAAATAPATTAPAATSQPVPATTPTAATQAAASASLAPTPACDDDDDEPTPAQTEGPYFTPNSPEKTSLLETGMAGTKLIVAGRVLTTDCQPVARALLDFWQADDAGQYDNAGFRLRGHQFTDETGRYQLETIVPGLYPGRTRHIHVKAQAPNRPTLTTQLYFPGEARNATDGIFNDKLLLTMQDAADGKLASFDFVLDLG